MGRDDFYHPYTPYHIQLQLMNAIYETIDNGYRVGLFESPTGTGKTLSLICSTMTWLREYKKQYLYKDIVDDEDEPEWVNQQYREKVLSRQKNLLKDYEINLEDIKFEATDEVVPKQKRRKIHIELEDDLIPRDYQSEGEDEKGDKNEVLSKEIKNLLYEIEGVPETIAAVSNPVKIFFSSRTHSQLSQFSSQLSELQFPSSFEDLKERIKYLPLGSRKQYCINDKINKHPVTQINDECLELQKSSSDSCTYFPTSETKPLVKLFTDLSFSEIHDIEDLVKIGEQVKICPYYSVRSGVDISEVISLPYQLLLEKSAREALNLNLKDSIIVIDEAHNLIDTIQAMNSTSVSLAEVEFLNVALANYFKKFKKRFNSGNRINLMRIMKIMKILQEFLSHKEIVNGQEFNVMEIYDSNTADLTNFYKLETYLHKSKIAYKLETYMERSSSQPLLFKVVSFLKSLSNPSDEGKFFFNRDSKGDVSMNYLLLNPAEIFTGLLDNCRTIILAGGTMEPMEDYQKYLFPSLTDDQIMKFTCDHIIPKDNLRSFIVSGHGSQRFEFTFSNRANTQMSIALADLIKKLIINIPHGVIVFFPSFRILDSVVSAWKAGRKYDELDKIKKIYLEDHHSNSNSNNNDTLASYTSNIDDGGLLLSVMNGKLSEGINFNDKLCRAVIMVGLPYPNEYASEMKLKKQYVYEKALARTNDKSLSEKLSREMVENTMIRIVNQSCGRCIRHLKDYSVIVMVDARYHKVSHKLSKWIRDRLITSGDSGDVIAGCRDFYSHPR